MLKVDFEDNITLPVTEAKLRNPSPLMRQWRDIRLELFQQQIDNELDPGDNNLRPLSRAYQAWKDSKYPGRKKRVLTGQTIASHKIYVSGSNRITESIGKKAIYLQFKLDLPLLPFDWYDPTAKALIDASIDYINEVK